MESRKAPSFFFFVMSDYYEIRISLEFSIFLPQPPKLWYYRQLLGMGMWACVWVCVQ